MKLEKGEMIQSRYRLVSLRGRGAYGEVWLAKDEQTDMDVAVKVYIALDDRGLEEFKEEFKNSYSLNHPNLLHAYHFDVVDRQPFLVMPYCPDSAESLVGKTDEKTLLRFVQDVAAGLEYLHSRDIIHRDIKPDNVLVNQEGDFVITDFGVSSKMKSTLRRNSTRAMSGSDIAGTIGYMAPELFSRTPDAVKATDIWALGATVHEMATGELPFFGQGGAMLMRGAEIPELPGEWSEGFRNMVEACLAKETWDRPTAAKLVEWAENLLKGREVLFPKSSAPVVDASATVRIQTPMVAPVAEVGKRSAVTAHTVVGAEESDKAKKSTFIKILLIIAIIVGLGLLFKDALAPRNETPGPAIVDKPVEDTTLFPSGNTINSSEAVEVEKTSPNDVKIKDTVKLRPDTSAEQSEESQKSNSKDVIEKRNETVTKQRVNDKDNSIKISQETASIGVGEYLTLRIHGFNGSFTWESEDPSIATVNQSGEVYAVKPGRTIIWAKIEGNFRLCRVTVIEHDSFSVFENRVISGIVRNSDGKPLEGISVKLKGKDYGAKTDASGYYSLMAKTSDVLVVSGAGFKTIEKTIQKNSNIDIILSSYESSSSTTQRDDVQPAEANSTKKVSGYVRDEHGKSLVGAAVIVRGKTNGTVVDINGAYSIIAAPGDVLVFSYMGCQDVSKTVGSENCIDVTLTQGKSRRR